MRYLGNKKAALIVGGTSGLGLELAVSLAAAYDVTVTGRQDCRREGVAYCPFDLSVKSAHTLRQGLDFLFTVMQANKRASIDLVVYAAGFYQEGTIDKLTDDDIMEMTKVGFLAPALLLRRILEKQKSIPGFIAITSTSQWTPRRLEPIYAGVKAGLGMLANSLSLDERIGKTLVVGPAGMNTRFWKGTDRDVSTLLDPHWAAEQTLRLYEGDFKYKFARILRDPPRTELVEQR
jgi:NAD(P)-dependent dehydrogenase (short-subunit alcohol dehydrogenase family)